MCGEVSAWRLYLCAQMNIRDDSEVCTSGSPSLGQSDDFFSWLGYTPHVVEGVSKLSLDTMGSPSIWSLVHLRRFRR
jgi:hypothetical protein